MPKCIAFMMSAAILVSSAVLLAAADTDDSDEAQGGGRPGFSVGFQCHYTILDPVWSKMDFNRTATLPILFRSSYKAMNYDNGRAFNYNPVFSIKFNNRVSLSGSYLYGAYSWKSMNLGATSSMSGVTLPSVFKQVFTVKKHDADLLVNVSVLKWLKVFIGPKYQAYIIREENTMFNNFILTSMSPMPIFPVTNPISFQSFGLGAGLGINFQVVAGLYFISNLSGIYLYGKDFTASSGTLGNQTSNLFGGIGSAAFAYYIDVMHTTLSAGFKAQYLSYSSTPRTVYTQKYDLFYGPFIAAVFSY